MNHPKLKTRCFHIAVLVALGWMTYWTSLNGAFVWDDQFQVERNTVIRDLRNIPGAFISSVWSFMRSGPCSDPARADDDACKTTSLNYYRPVQTAMFSAAYSIGGLDPFYYHVLNIVTHCLATVFIYLLCLELAFPIGTALLAGMLFAVHPIHTEAVAWISAAGEVAGGAFYFAALWAFARFANTRRVAWICLSGILFLGALFSKEMAVTLPLFVLGLIVIYRKWRLASRQVVLPLICYAATFAIYLFFRLSALGFTIAPSTVTAGILDWVTLGVSVLGRYLWFIIIPFPLSAYHSIPISVSDRWGDVVISAAAIGALLFLLRRSWRNRPEAAGWFCLFLVTLIPVFNFKAIVIGW